MGLIEKLLMMVGVGYSCEDANAFIADYIDGALEPDVERRFDTHIRNCANCGPFLDEYRDTVRITKAEGSVDVPEELIEHTIAFLRTTLPTA